MKQRRKSIRKKQEKPKPKRLFAQPNIHFYTMPEIEMRDNRIFTEGCRRVMSVTSKEICLDVGKRLITFYGDELQIEFLSGRRLAIQGKVDHVAIGEKQKEEQE